ncbi:MAG: hypothetical protein K9I94_07950 [Bacteroidales bacterium]|nr:hypothetical protein [Bacteroidales bacterium]
MKRALLLSVLLSILFSAGFAQIDKMRDKLEDSNRELETGQLTLRFINALDGEAVSGAKVKIHEMGKYTTDPLGRIIFDPPEDGVYAMHFEKEGFITADMEFEISRGTIFYNRFTVSPHVDIGTIRIVLDWDDKPEDLDAHFKKVNGYHISYRDMKTYNDGEVKLDRDDRDGFGPETITVTDLDDAGEYSFYVKDYTNRDRKHSKRLSKSKARVKVYGEGALLHEFQLSEKQKGSTWMVFRIVDGQIKPVEEVNRYY